MLYVYFTSIKNILENVLLNALQWKKTNDLKPKALIETIIFII